MSEAPENDREDSVPDGSDEAEQAAYPGEGVDTVEESAGQLEFGTDDASEGGYQRFDCTPGAATREAGIEAARAAVERGECVVLPTDTVYGIGADAFDGGAVQGLLDAKHRGRDMPPPVLIADASLIRALASDVPEQAKDLVARHWPGPLTVICTMQPSLRMDLGETAGTIALRVPDHELTREVLRATGPIAVSSANLSGQPAALTCDEAVEQLGDAVSVYLDGGPLSATGGLPSTMVDFSRHEDGEVLRHGALDVAVLRETLPDLVDLVEADPEPSAPEPSDPEPSAPEPEPERSGSTALTDDGPVPAGA